jgi:hypothetical protein
VSHYPKVPSASGGQQPTVCSAYPNKTQRNKKRGDHKEHCRAVVSGLTPPRTILPGPSPPLPLDDANFIMKDLRKEFHINSGEHPTAQSLCIMGWSCKGRLYASNQHYDYLVANFLNGKRSHMKKYDVDIKWLPNFRFYLFPTTISATNSNNKSNENIEKLGE